MGVKVNLEQLSEQATSTKAAVNDIKTQIKNIQQKVQAFNDSGMEGASIQSATGFISSTIIPTLASTDATLDTIANNAQKLVDTYQTSVDTKSWSEEELQEKIDNLNTMIKENEDRIKKIKEKNKSEEKKNIKSISTLMMEGITDNLQQQKQHYEEILNHLREYNNRSTSLLEEISDVVMQGITAINSGYNGGKGKDAFKSKDSDFLSKAVKLVTLENVDNLGLGMRDLAVYMTLDKDERKKFKKDYKLKRKKHLKELNKVKRFRDRIKQKHKYRKHMKNSHTKIKEAEKLSTKKKSKMIKNIKRAKDMQKRCKITRSSKKNHKYRKYINKKLKNLRISRKLTKYGKKINKVVDNIKKSKTFQVLETTGKLFDGLNSVSDVHKRQKKGMSFGSSVGVELGSKAIGIAAGMAAGAAIGAIPGIGVVAGPIAKTVVSSYVEEKSEKMLEKSVKKGQKK